MLLAWGAALGAGISATSSLLGSILQNVQSKKESRKARAWAEYMASTQYQRTMEDMRQAGLNPILAYQSGASSVPSVPQSPSIANIGEGFGDSARGVAEKMQELKTAQEEFKNIRRTGEVMDAQKLKYKYEAGEAAAKTNLAAEEAATARDSRAAYIEQLMSNSAHLKTLSSKEGVSRQLLELELPGARAEARVWDSPVGTWLKGAQAASGAIPRIPFVFGRVRSRAERPGAPAPYNPKKYYK